MPRKRTYLSLTNEPGATGRAQPDETRLELRPFTLALFFSTPYTLRVGRSFLHRIKCHYYVESTTRRERFKALVVRRSHPYRGRSTAGTGAQGAPSLAALRSLHP